MTINPIPSKITYSEQVINNNNLTIQSNNFIFENNSNSELKNEFKNVETQIVRDDFGKKCTAHVEKIYEEKDGKMFEITTIIYVDSKGNNVKDIKSVCNEIRNYDNEDINFELTHIIHRVANPDETFITTVITDREENKYHVRETIVTTEKIKEGYKTKSNTNTKKINEDKIKRCKMPQSFVIDYLIAYS